ncbi:MAG: phosphotransferase [Paramuribaculum sp.]|nr:phosphotransferase [Paramuribaculum sp.]
MSQCSDDIAISQLRNLYERFVGADASMVFPIAQDGSSRKYWRFQSVDNEPLVGCCGLDVRENDAFIYLSGLLHDAGINVPSVKAVSDTGQEYLQSDLGSLSLYDVISQQGSTDCKVMYLADKCMSELAKVHYVTVGKVDYSRCFPRPAMDMRSVMWDLNYFKYCFLKPLGVMIDEDCLERDFETVASMIDNVAVKVLMLRDFQSRNIMVHNEEPWIIDFQGARLGPAAYDVASFAWQARAGFPASMRHDIVERYVVHAREYELFNEDDFRKSYPLCVLVRLIQVLGAYGFRGLIERKSKFITPIPDAVALMAELLTDNPMREIPYLMNLLRRLCFHPLLQHSAPRSGLVVDVSSFSYKKGVPVDNSGNGGGFVFDCRAVHNPGRYEMYKPLTGLDQPVIEFLESNGEIADFLHNVYELVDNAVDRYMKRGFTHLCVHFGCTGGRHRSVYSAQHLAEHINSKFGVEVNLCHREQGITQKFPAR